MVLRFLKQCSCLRINYFGLEDKIFIGAAPWIQDNLGSSEYRFPPTVLMASLRKGYVGCLRNVRVNGISSEIASVYEDQKTIFGDGK